MKTPFPRHFFGHNPAYVAYNTLIWRRRAAHVRLGAQAFAGEGMTQNISRRYIQYLLATIAIALIATAASAQTLRPLLPKNPAGDQRTQINQRFIPQAELVFHDRELVVDGQIAGIATHLYLPPSAQEQRIVFGTKLSQNEKTARILWQVSAMPFAPRAFGADLENPYGLVASGLTRADQFAVDFANLLNAHQWRPYIQRRPKTLGGPARPQIVVPKPAQSAVNTKTGQPKLVTKSINKAPAKPGGTKLKTKSATFHLASGSYYIRAIPVAPSGPPRIIGRPSQTLVVHWHEATQADYNLHIKPDTVERINVRVTGFEFAPMVSYARWPAGCTPVEKADDGPGFPKNVIDWVSGAIDWASQTYADLKASVVSSVVSIMTIIPGVDKKWATTVFQTALDAALTSAGIPPSLPNMDKLMNEGADYLAFQVAEQIPVPASGPLAEMALDEARAEMQRQSKQALLAAADTLEDKLAAKQKHCISKWEAPYLMVSVQNTSPSEVYENVTFSVSDSASLFEGVSFDIRSLKPGQKMRVPVTIVDKPNLNIPFGVYSLSDLQSDWWAKYPLTAFNFTVYGPSDQVCSQEGYCASQSRALYTSPKRQWYTGPGFKWGD